MLRCGVVAFARWDPYRDLVAIRHQMERLSSADVQGWAPAVDLAETADAFIITAELPGLTREQLRINLHDGRLTIQGRRDARVACEHYHQVERGHGGFSRSFPLPASADTHGIAAELVDGVLTVTVPKSEIVRPRQVIVS